VLAFARYQESGLNTKWKNQANPGRGPVLLPVSQGSLEKSASGNTLAVSLLIMRILATRLLFFTIAASCFASDLLPVHSSSSRFLLERNWHLQSACKLSDSGATISRPGYNVAGWLSTTVPHTVLGAQVDAKLFPDPFYGMNLRAIPGTTYPLGKIFTELPMPDDSPYKCSWWYRTEFQLPAQLQGKNIWLHFDGINYRANIWANGKQIANSDQVAGAYRTYEFNLKETARAGTLNAVAVEVFTQTETDLGVNFVDWNPAPADKSMGLWRPVYITTSGPVSIRFPAVSTHFTDDSLNTAELSVAGELQNGTAEPVTGTVEAALEGIGTLEQQVTLGPNEHQSVVFAPEQYPVLRVQNPKLWWPYQLGSQNLQTLEMRFQSADSVSDSAIVKFGIREITAEKNQNGYELLSVNHRHILIRGGGWAPDMFLRVNTQRTQDELRHVRNLGLNTIRLEGKMETDEFFDLADRYGILVMAGWCCCDHWEHWDKWTAADHEISKASQASQIQRLRSHPSLLVWLNGSDNPPPADVESDYVAILKQYRWPNPYISSASAAPTTVTGPSGVKMSGPYDYVPPSYWLRDPGHWGGAWGFNTETSPGPAPPLLSSQEKFIPKQNLWPHDDVWNFHAGLGSFGQTNIFDNAMAVTYGPPTSPLDYEKKSQAMAYDGERAMFEAYARNKYNSTGVVQWMLNNAWPSVIWHLYDYYLVPGGGYFGVKKANELVHAQYSYDDRSVVIVNSLYNPQKSLKLRVRVLDLSSKERFSDTKTVDIDLDSVTRVLTVPDIVDLNSPYFVRLDLTDPAGKTLSSNFYWLPTQLADFDWEKTNYYTTPAKYADMTGLATLPATNVEWNSQTEHHGDDEIVRVTLRNVGRNLAFLVRVDVRHPHTSDDVVPVLWDDNYISLLPGESRTLTASVRARDLVGFAPLITVQGWNINAQTAAKLPR
jgi:exo-1,4-beta-D-glucosaminidase